MSTITGVIWAIGALVLVVSALAARRLPMKTMVRDALLWVALFGVLALVIIGLQSFGLLQDR